MNIAKVEESVENKASLDARVRIETVEIRETLVDLHSIRSSSITSIRFVRKPVAPYCL